MYLEAMQLTADDVRKIASLSRLHVPEDRLEAVAADLQPILGHLEELASLDLSDVEPMMHPDASPRPLRADEPQPSLPREVVFANAPSAADGFFVIPKVIGAV
jgi:aspartyl-tRNA(Asn)/glutamyl-tRNA(Gln) amidotransferase subunit C